MLPSYRSCVSEMNEISIFSVFLYFEALHVQIDKTGGGDGVVGRNALRSRDGLEKELDGRVQLKCYAGEAVIIQTPSGGGYGASTE